MSMIPASRAPTAGALRRTPSPTGPTSRMSRAKSGSRATAPPNRTATRSSEIAPSSTGVFRTNRRPASSEPSRVPTSRRRRLLDGSRLDRGDDRRGHEHEQCAGGVDGLRVDREEQAADRRPGHHGRLEDRRAQRERPRQQLERDEARPHRANRRVPDRGRGAAREREGEERPERPGPVEADEQQQSRDRRVRDERADQDELARQPVRDRAGGQREEQQRQELGEADQAEVERVPVDVVDLPADRDEHHLAPEPVRDRRAQEPRVVALAQYRGKAPSHSDREGIPTMRTCAQSCSTRTDSPGSRRHPRRPTRCACSRAASAARTSRRSAGRPRARCSGTRSSRSRADGRRVALLHHLPCGDVRALPRRARVDVRGVRRADDRPRRLRRAGGARPTGSSFRTRSTTRPARYVEPLACVLRGAERVPRGRVLVVGHGFVGRLFSEVLRRRGDEVFAVDSNPERDRAGARTARSTRPSSARRRRRSTRSRPAAPSSSSPAPARSTWTRSTGAS